MRQANLFNFTRLFALLGVLFIALSFTPVQTMRNKYMVKNGSDSDSIVFRDKVSGWLTDSLMNNMGVVAPEISYFRKRFKYIGKDTIWITRAWTGDPHFICEYPREPLINNKVYEFKICFSHVGRPGYFYKVMGFDLSNGLVISYTFKGEVKIENKEPKQPERN